MSLSRVVGRTEEHLLLDGLGVDAADLPLRHPIGLIVGEQPGPNSSRACPMFPYPASSAGGRLLAMSDIPIHEYLTLLRRINVQEVNGPWRLLGARARAAVIAEDAASLYGPLRVVLCGRRVAKAFWLGDLPWFKRYRFPQPDWQHTYVVVPHPSARNQLYNDPTVAHRAGAAVRWAAGLED